jgi:hypothetical protein
MKFEIGDDSRGLALLPVREIEQGLLLPRLRMLLID